MHDWFNRHVGFWFGCVVLAAAMTGYEFLTGWPSVWLLQALPTIHAGIGWATVWMGALLLVFAVGFLTYGPVGDLRKRVGSVPEALPLYDLSSIRAYHNAAIGPDMGFEPEDLYREELRLDVGFAMVYGLTWTLFLWGTLGHLLDSSDWQWWLLFAPAAAAIVDLSEDALLLSVVAKLADARRSEHFLIEELEVTEVDVVEVTSAGFTETDVQEVDLTLTEVDVEFQQLSKREVSGLEKKVAWARVMTWLKLGFCAAATGATVSVLWVGAT